MVIVMSKTTITIEKTVRNKLTKVNAIIVLKEKKDSNLELTDIIDYISDYFLEREENFNEN